MVRKEILTCFLSCQEWTKIGDLVDKVCHPDADSDFRRIVFNQVIFLAKDGVLKYKGVGGSYGTCWGDASVRLFTQSEIPDRRKEIVDKIMEGRNEV